jgi:hypothetical protein
MSSGYYAMLNFVMECETRLSSDRCTIPSELSGQSSAIVTKRWIIESTARLTRRKEWFPFDYEIPPEPHHPPRHDQDHAPTSGTFINFEDEL